MNFNTRKVFLLAYYCSRTVLIRYDCPCIKSLAFSEVIAV